MDVDLPLQLLGGLSPSVFMRRHWQRKPLMVRGAVSVADGMLQRDALFSLAASEDVESRLVVGGEGRGAPQWTMRRGPFRRRALPPLRRPGWTLLVQGVDLHDESARGLLDRFRFLPEARLDDIMVSYASDSGGVGPHFDSYDVFLLQAHGRRRWRIGRQNDLTLRDGLPLKILRRFTPDQEFILEPGDMLYLPPRYAHDGVAMGECMTYSVGFRAPGRTELAGELLQRLAQEQEEPADDVLYGDAGQQAVGSPAAIPDALKAFAQRALQRATEDPSLVQRVLGEYLTEPKATVWFDAGAAGGARGSLRLDRRTRMMYDSQHIYINGESFRAGGRDAKLMRRFADARSLSAEDRAQASAQARALLLDWCKAGWIHGT